MAVSAGACAGVNVSVGVHVGVGVGVEAGVNKSQISSRPQLMIVSSTISLQVL